MEFENKNHLQKQIDWLNINLKREIQERFAAGARFSGTAWHLDRRIQKLEKIKLLNIHKHYCCVLLVQTSIIGLLYYYMR